MVERNDGSAPVDKWAKLYNAGMSIRGISESEKVDKDKIREALRDAGVEMRPRGGRINAGRFQPRNPHGRAIPLKSMSIAERAETLANVNAPVYELLFLYAQIGPETEVHLRDFMEVFPEELSWLKANDARKSLERRMFVTSRIIETRFGPRRYASVTEDGMQAAKIIGLSKTGPSPRKSTDLSHLSRSHNAGTFSVGDGRPRKVPLSSLPLGKRVETMSLVSAPVWEVLAVLCEAPDGQGLATGAIKSKLQSDKAWQCVDNACKALIKRAFATASVDMDAGWSRRLTKVTEDGKRAAKLRK